jgi:hypothetical protein
VVGGFYLQKFWPLPLIVIVAILGRDVPINTEILPKWWPAIIPDGQSLQTVTLQLTGLVAVLGYGDMTLSRTPKKKTEISAVRLLIYSISLLGLSLLSSKLYVFKFVAALFAPIAHEGLILYSQREEKGRKRLFEAGDTGMTVLFVEKDGPGFSMGLKPGDRIMQINNRSILGDADFKEVLGERLSFIWIEVMHVNGKTEIKEYTDYESGVADLKCLYVERHPYTVYRFDGKGNSKFKRLLKYLKKN